MTILTQRRSLLTAILASLVPRQAHSAPTLDPMPIDPEPLLFLVEGQFLEVDPVARTIRGVPRWEVLRDSKTPQPEPLRTEKEAGRTHRFWRPDDVRSCRLCARCTVHAIEPVAFEVGALPESLRGALWCSVADVADEPIALRL